jgi:hypothetical protein
MYCAHARVGYLLLAQSCAVFDMFQRSGSVHHAVGQNVLSQNYTLESSAGGRTASNEMYNHAGGQGFPFD